MLTSRKPAPAALHSRFSNQRRIAMLSALGLSVAAPGLAHSAALAYPQLKLNLYNLHTTEHADVVFWEDGEYNTDNLAKINRLLRDHRTGGVIPIDPRLLSIVYLVNTKLGNTHPVSVISGYRSKQTNQMLAKTNAGVARNSYHIQGRAIDLRIEGVETKSIRDIGIKLRLGGVGYYEKSDFVHLDTGPRRSW